MSRLLKAFFYKISKDITFRITLIIGGGIALISVLLFFLLDLLIDLEGVKLLTGHGMLITSFSPTQNYGIAIPINVVSFIVLEFTQGTIRNKIIAGHSKFKIYTSLVLSGLVLTFALLIAYAGLCTLIGIIFGGFDLSNPIVLLTLSIAGAYAEPIYIVQMLLTAVVVYICIVCYTVFFAALFRSVGPCIPIVILALIMLSLGGSLIASIGSILEDEALINFVKIVDPLFVISGGGTEMSYMVKNENMVEYVSLDTSAFVATIINNLVYAAIFYAGGTLIFMKRDVK
jgi:ABC-type transport system involved in multi-copper enzyme maturation permease subunit